MSDFLKQKPKVVYSLLLICGALLVLLWSKYGSDAAAIGAIAVLAMMHVGRAAFYWFVQRIVDERGG